MILKDYFLSQESFSLVKNESFGFLETHPQPLDRLADYYESPDYISHTDGHKTWFEKIYQFIKKRNIRYKFSLIQSKTNSKNLLDYGCGAGDFLAYAQSKNWQVMGVEPNEKARGLAQKKIGKNLVKNLELKEIDQQFDVITLWHVLEHIPNLFEFMESLKSKLKENGQLIIAVPNHQSFDAKHYKNYWAAYDVPRHLWHFEPKSMAKFLSYYGFEIEKIHPLWYDSFYVSLLSEKFKKNKLGWLSATLVAFTSNFLAMFDKNYSSIVYQIKKT